MKLKPAEKILVASFGLILAALTWLYLGQRAALQQRSASEVSCATAAKGRPCAEYGTLLDLYTPYYRR